jgi:putative nucleotidyltransferase with HDIG domain
MDIFTSQVRVYSDGVRPPADIVDLLSPHFKIASERYGQMAVHSDFSHDILVFDLGQNHEASLDSISAWRSGASLKRSIVIYVTSEEGRKALISRGMLEGSNCVRRPLSDINLTSLAQTLSHQRYGEMDRKATDFRERLEKQFADQAPAVLAGASILDELMGAFDVTRRFDVKAISEKTSILVDTLGATGLDRWISSVRHHHDATYQHCLLVTGTLVAFGHQFRLGQADLQRLAVGGLLHDLGKADVPVEILDKPSSLTPAEMEIIRTHPAAGVARARQARGMTEELLQLIGGHHEYLDGSGYPNGLAGSAISDPVRLLTIADIFAALVEYRTYKPQMSSANALAILHRMTGKIDFDFLAAVTPAMARVAP